MRIMLTLAVLILAGCATPQQRYQTASERLRQEPGDTIAYCWVRPSDKGKSDAGCPDKAARADLEECKASLIAQSKTRPSLKEAKSRLEKCMNDREWVRDVWIVVNG
jgi:hypothetical protein